MTIHKDQTSKTELAVSLVELYVAIQQIYARSSRQVGITPQQAHLLCIADHQTPTLGELATELGCDKTNITGLVDRVANRGLVERIGDDNDRRVKRVQVTQLGHNLVDRFDRELADRLDNIDPAIGITPAMIDALTAHLRPYRDS